MVNIQEVKYSDREIAALIKERKILRDDWRDRLYRTGSLDVEGEDGNKFRIIVRPGHSIRPSDFSVILMVLGPRSNLEFKLRRYNGWTSVPSSFKLAVIRICLKRCPCVRICDIPQGGRT